MKNIFIAMLLIGVIALAGCVNNSNTNTTNQQSYQNPQQNISQNSGRSGVVAVHFTELYPFLPSDPAGYTGDEPQGYAASDSGGNFSFASKRYIKDGTEDYDYPLRITVQIIDTAFSEDVPFVYLQQTEFEDDTGYGRKTTISGYSALEKYSKGDATVPDTYGVYVYINERFIVVSEANDRETAYKIANRINYAGIAALG